MQPAADAAITSDGDATADLGKQLDRIRKRLEKALLGLEERVAALESNPTSEGDPAAASVDVPSDLAERLASLEARLTMVETRTKSAVQRSTTAAARSAKVLEALEDLGRELQTIAVAVAVADDSIAEQLADATDRLRSRVAAVALLKK